MQWSMPRAFHVVPAIPQADQHGGLGYTFVTADDHWTWRTDSTGRAVGAGKAVHWSRGRWEFVSPRPRPLASELAEPPAKIRRGTSLSNRRLWTRVSIDLSPKVSDSNRPRLSLSGATGVPRNHLSRPYPGIWTDTDTTLNDCENGFHTRHPGALT